MLSILAFPFHVLASIIRFVFGTLRIPLPQFPFGSLNFYRPFGNRNTGPSAPYSIADRWVRALEDETGALCLSRARAGRVDAAGPSNALASSTSANLRSRYGSIGGKVLPDFFLGSYEEALQTCQKEARIGCIVVLSDEHDDVAEFKRNTLTDQTLVDLLHANEFIVWGGDVRNREGWSAAQKLQATTYPFVAFVALQPPRNSSFASSSSTRSSSSPTLTILSRHQGSSISSSGPTSATTLADHITNQLLPRVGPFLERIKSAARQRELERLLREEQDRAFEESARRDREKIDARILSEKLAEEERRAKEERKAQEEAERARKEGVKAGWRKWARKELIPSEPTDARDSVRVTLRLPDGQRLVRAFCTTDTVTALYSLVDARLIPAESLPENEKATSSEPGEAGLAHLIESSGDDADSWWGFKLFLAYPRREITWKAAAQLGGIEGLERGGQIVVEIISQRASISEAAEGNDDGYDTEESV
ncbi:hypothetical protein EW146_g7978 [Bondarzewia mesenterica]|uniref:UBX domain-containing protein n=1 Tax=Bondarzewia mesenterica TaxID=1095465 RepID=A0A4S4LI74_9AGAM|nr:hypothetical protein EW146_g7978 [Bondarzewia mesenterica]